jgi:hypothetical protein
VSAHDEHFFLATKLNFVLCPFEGRSIDEAFLTELTKVLHEELASVLDGRRIRLVRESWGIRVELASAPQANTPPVERPTNAGLAGLDAVKAALAA